MNTVNLFLFLKLRIDEKTQNHCDVKDSDDIYTLCYYVDISVSKYKSSLNFFFFSPLGPVENHEEVQFQNCE